jgi:hypothetical protein
MNNSHYAAVIPGRASSREPGIHNPSRTRLTTTVPHRAAAAYGFRARAPSGAHPGMTACNAVIAGLDPAIHRLHQNASLRNGMDARVKPAHDGGGRRSAGRCLSKLRAVIPGRASSREPGIHNPWRTRLTTTVPHRAAAAYGFRACAPSGAHPGMTACNAVIAGLDPAIHRRRQNAALRSGTDARVEPAHDGGGRRRALRARACDTRRRAPTRTT